MLGAISACRGADTVPASQLPPPQTVPMLGSGKETPEQIQYRRRQLAVFVVYTDHKMRRPRKRIRCLMTLSPARRWIPTARDNTLYLVSIIWPDHVLICLPCGGRPVRAGETRAIQTVVCAGKSLGVLAPRLKGAKGVGDPCSTTPVAPFCVCVKQLEPFSSHYLSWKLLVCAPEPWVLIVFILSTPLPFHASAFPPFPPCSSARFVLSSFS